MPFPPLLELLVPERCAGCGRVATLVCPDCREALVRIRPPLCARCGAPSAWPVERCRECAGRRIPFRSARAAVVYDALARRLVLAWKERGLRRLASVAAELVARTVARPPAALLTPVPADRDRTLWRGSSPAEALAAELARRWQLPTACLLVRGAGRRRQRGLGRNERRANVRGLFASPAVPRAAVLLVDDVFTTGATVGAAAAELRRAGARTVDVVTFARAVRGA